MFIVDLAENYLHVADVVMRLLAEPAVASAWDEPSVLPLYSVSGLAGHLAGQIGVVQKVLDAPDPVASPVTAADYLLQARWVDAEEDGDVHAGIRASASAYAAEGPAALVSSTAATLADLHHRLPLQSPGRNVQFPWGPPAMRLHDLLLNRLMELVVHVDDLAQSVGTATPALPPAAVDSVMRLLVDVASRRHGALEVVRYFARPERLRSAPTAF